MTSKRFALLTALSAILLTFGALQLAVAQQQQARSPQFEQQIVETVNGINEAFMRGDLRELNSYMHEEVTMLHGHERLNNLREVEKEWTSLFAVRARAAMNYTLKIRDLKTQVYGDVIVVTFGYEHPRMAGAKIATESGKAVYVLLRQPEAPQARIAGKKPIVMVHCAVIADRPGNPQSPLP
jgi:hypothetical protein